MEHIYLFYFTKMRKVFNPSSQLITYHLANGVWQNSLRVSKTEGLFFKDCMYWVIKVVKVAFLNPKFLLM